MEWNRQTETGPLEWLLNNYDDIGIVKGAWHTKRTLAQLIQPRGTITHYE